MSLRKIDAHHFDGTLTNHCFFMGTCSVSTASDPEDHKIHMIIVKIKDETN